MTESKIDPELSTLIPPLVSLCSKSEKAQKKCKPGTWQYTRLQNYVKVLSYVLVLMHQENPPERPSLAAYQDMAQSLASLCNKTEKALHKATADTASHTLLWNRLQALQTATLYLTHSATQGRD